MHSKKTGIALIIGCMILVCMSPLGIFAAGTVQGEVLFQVEEPDQNGVFYVAMSIRNATFNTFQFALKYDVSSMKPINADGSSASAFGAFATLSKEATGIAPIGTNLDSNAGLIELAGYVMPGEVLYTDDMQQRAGYAVIGSSGMEIYRFRFQKTNGQSIRLELATMAGGQPYSKSLPEGGALFDAGLSVPIAIKFEIPAALGTGSTVISGGDQDEVALTKEERLKNTIALQIGNYGAAAGGALISIDSNNPDVRPYIDGNNRTMVPVRFISEQLGASVAWNGETEQITIVSGNRTIVMSIGSGTYTINGVAYTMDTAPLIVQGWNRTVVPIRFVSEALGRAVEWDAENQLVLITDQSEPWQSDRDAEKQATQSILFVISDLVRDFI